MNEKFALVTLDDKRKETRANLTNWKHILIDKQKNDESLT